MGFKPLALARWSLCGSKFKTEDQLAKASGSISHKKSSPDAWGRPGRGG